jgi:hypothetical protein
MRRVCYTGKMNVRGLARLLALGGFLLSAYNYCPPDAQAAPLQAVDCCHAKTDKNDCPLKKKDAAGMRSCCTAERLAPDQGRSKIISVQLAAQPYLVPVTFTAPQVFSHRLARALIRPVGPPRLRPAALGTRAPPLA